MHLRVMAGLLLISLILIAAMPSESSLGESYKLVYIHVPVTAVMIVSLILFPILHFRMALSDIRSFSTATSVYSIIHLIVSLIFMYVSWGGIVFSEVRFAFSVTLFLFAITHTFLCFLDSGLARAYSFFIYPIILYFYAVLSRTEFQLHPTAVKMPLLLYIPYIFSVPLVLLLYFQLKNFVRSKC